MIIIHVVSEEDHMALIARKPDFVTCEYIITPSFMNIHARLDPL